MHTLEAWGKELAQENDGLVAELDRLTQRAMQLDAPLTERLALVARELAVLSPDFATAVDAFLAKLEAGEAGEGAPMIGETLPGFVLPDLHGRLNTLADLSHAGGPLVVVFLRGHWCPYCRVHASALGEMHEAARALGGQIVAITPEHRTYAAALAEEAGNAFPILTDIGTGYAASINLAVRIDDALGQLLLAGGWDVPRFNRDDAWIVPIPASFVLDRHGRIAARHVNPDYRDRMDIEAVLIALRSLPEAELPDTRPRAED